MGYTLALPVMIVLAALQTSLLPLLRWQNSQPDLILLLVLAWAVRAPLPEALFWAVVGGICADLLSIVPLGVSILAPALGVLLIDALRRRLYGVNPFLWLLVVIAMTLLHELLMVVGLVLVRYTVPLNEFVRSVLLPTLAYHVILAWPLYGLVRLVQARWQARLWAERQGRWRN
ncbi:MAG: rod shape-determining protein MreD [Anaerolineae bacterium]|nr:rod shape-determining protein MreD [Anaerolineae bacterium]MDW8172748.1 rod shape-determining protein MreD [Anaerolineae bacterium]